MSAISLRRARDYFEGMGFLLYRLLIDIDIVHYVAGGTVKMAWKKLKPMFEGFREEYNMPETMRWFEYVYNEMQKREQRLTKSNNKSWFIGTQLVAGNEKMTIDWKEVENTTDGHSLQNSAVSSKIE